LLLLEVWRETGRHDEIEETVERIAVLVARALPVEALLVRHVDRGRMLLETVAAATANGTTPPPHARTVLSPRKMDALLAWGRRGGVARGSAAAADPVLEAAAPPGCAGDVIAGPLTEGEEVFGVLVVTGPRHAYRAEHEDTVRQLLEPLSALLRSDLHRHETSRLREALEADRDALLTRLGRQEIAEAVVGTDAGLRVVMERVEQVAATEVPVLLLGETGTGKEVVAREIHRRSRRASGPVVRVNCGAIPPGLIDSELFGHERGSFTGAVGERAGWFERADGGTLFLDEIGELPPDAQVRLLRVLQDGTFERVGGHRTHTVDVRIVAATHRDLSAMVQAGRFREDLWYRISTFPIRLPPLRERVGDIPALAEHFAWRAGKRLGGGPLSPTPADLELLIAYPWPGNVRELTAVIERAAILGGGRRLDVAGALGYAVPLPPTPPAAGPAPSAPPGILPLDTAIARHIEQALAATRGRIEGPFGAAAVLGVNPHTLRARMRRLRVDWARFRAAPAPTGPGGDA
jgi:hydrogenase-4 transcriptional activator